MILTVFNFFAQSITDYFIFFVHLHIYQILWANKVWTAFDK